MEPTRLTGESGTPASGSGPGHTLAVLGGVALGELLPSRAADAVYDWVASGEGVLWLRGPAGSGRTTAAGAAIRKILAERPQHLRGAFRLESVQGMRFEEVLFDLNQFLRQLGIYELDTVLNQRTSLSSKIAI